jgi:hypothetical protein
LPRGGWLVETCEGNIEFGIVPETVKDSLSMGLQVPRHYIIPTQKFDKVFGLSVCEFEFPAYFSFFICGGKKVNLICTEQEADLIREIF